VFKRLLGTDQEFFGLFASIATRLTGAATHLHRLLAEPARADETLAVIRRLERESDELVHRLRVRMSEVFLGPIDAEDMLLLGGALETVIDGIEDIALLVAAFRLGAVREPALRLADVLARACGRLEAAMSRMKDAPFITGRCREVKVLEEEGDAMYSAAIRDLFAGEPDPLDVIKWKALYELLEDTIDDCAHAANVLQRVALKHA
jgi:uncharacterized protein